MAVVPALKLIGEGAWSLERDSLVWAVGCVHQLPVWSIFQQNCREVMWIRVLYPGVLVLHMFHLFHLKLSHINCEGFLGGYTLEDQRLEPTNHPWKERKMIFLSPPWGNVPAVNLQGCNSSNYIFSCFPMFFVDPQTHMYFKLAGGFKYVHPYVGKMNPFWRAYVSNGLVQPPTNKGESSLGRIATWRRRREITSKSVGGAGQGPGDRSRRSPNLVGCWGYIWDIILPSCVGNK